MTRVQHVIHFKEYKDKLIMKKYLLKIELIGLSLLMAFNCFANPYIAWNPHQFGVEHAQGVNIEHQISFTPSKDVDDVYLWVTPSLSEYLSVSPTEIGDIRKGQPVSITVTVTIAPSTEVGIYDGVIQLHTSTRNGVLARPLPIEITVTEDTSGELPSDPGEEGKKTLLGIDSDGDGVRDDIQRYIMQTYPEQKRLQKALFEYTKQFQKILQVADNKEASRQAVDVKRARSQCLSSIVQDGYKYLRKLIPVILNTVERNKRYILFNKQLAGYISNSHRAVSEWHLSCNFDVNAIEETL